MPANAEVQVRAATSVDGPDLLRLWDLLFETDAVDAEWRDHAARWLEQVVADDRVAHIAVIEAAGRVVASAIGTLELGVPNPHCPRGRVVRLANVITHPAHRGKGYGTLLVRDVVRWARDIEADRVDLSASEDGQRIYQHEGFVVTSAPRMKLLL